MKIQTQNQLLDKIAAERVWRIQEISCLRGQCLGSRVPTNIAKALRRSFVPVAYAHWEGFVKRTSYYYLEYVAMQRLRLGELNYPIMALYLWKRYAQQLQTRKPFALVEACQAMLSQGGERVWIQGEDVLPNTSNLNTKTLREICDTLGLPFDGFETKALFLDRVLLARRNPIAHGESQEVDEEEMETIKDEVVTLIDMFRNEVENAAVMGTFKQPG